MTVCDSIIRWRMLQSSDSDLPSRQPRRQCSANGCARPQHVVAEFARVGEIGDAPAVDAVFGHAFFGKSLETVRIARGLGAEQAVAADFLGRAAIVDLVGGLAAPAFAPPAVPPHLAE